MKNSLKNDLDAKDIKSRADNVKDLAGNAHESVTQVRNSVGVSSEIFSHKC